MKREARYALLLPEGDGVAEVHGAAAFADIVYVPGGDLDFDVAQHDALAAQARAQGQTGSHVAAVSLVIVHLGQVVHTVFHNDMTGGAGAVATAGMLQVDSEIQTNIEN